MLLARHALERQHHCRRDGGFAISLHRFGSALSLVQKTKPCRVCSFEAVEVTIAQQAKVADGDSLKTPALQLDGDRYRDILILRKRIRRESAAP